MDIPGAFCGDPVFDDCDGSWDYGLDCDPFYYECCVPSDPPTQSTTTDTTTTNPSDNGTTVTVPTIPPGGTISNLLTYFLMTLALNFYYFSE